MKFASLQTTNSLNSKFMSLTIFLQTLKVGNFTGNPGQILNYRIATRCVCDDIDKLRNLKKVQTTKIISYFRIAFRQNFFLFIDIESVLTVCVLYL